MKLAPAHDLTVRAIGLVASIAFTVVMACVGSASANWFDKGHSGFCTPKKPVRDFGLSKLPPVHEVPESAKGLGYGAVTMSGHWSRVMPRPMPVGYGFYEHSYTEKGVLLNWTVTAQLWAIGRRGTTSREVDRDELFIGRLNADHQPSVEVEPLRGRRGFYRFDMQIRNQAGKALGSYGTYFKVVRPSWSPRLRLSRDVAQPGERLLFRLDNYGSESVLYPEPFSIRHFENGRWILADDLTPDRWLMRLGLLGPGGTGGCVSLLLPPDTPPGLYRVFRGVRTKRYPEGKAESLSAIFEVLGSGVTIQY